MTRALSRMLGRHLGEDADGEGVERRLERMVRESSPDERRRAAAEIAWLLDGHLCEAQIRDALLYEIGCGYPFERDGFEASSWLRHVRGWLGDPRGC